MKGKNYLERKSQLSDLNRVPARYEGAALPGELSWQIKQAEASLPKKASSDKV